MTHLHEIAYRLDPVLWVRDKLQMTATPWQETFLRAPRGASILALTARQVGKTTTAAWAIAQTMWFKPGSLSVIACPAQRQSAEAVRRVRDCLIKVSAKLVNDNVYGLELSNGSRVLALPGSDDSIRGLTVDGWIVADEAARLSEQSDRGAASDAGAPPGGAFCHAVDRLEPDRPVLDGLGRAMTRPGSGSRRPPTRCRRSMKTSWPASAAPWGRRFSSANILACLRADRPAPSPGSFTSGRR